MNHDRVLGAQHDLGEIIQTHLFILSPNQSGSTFVMRAIARCKAVWSLPREGQHVLGFTGVDTLGTGISLTWAADPQDVQALQDPAAYNWPSTRKAWYFQATAASCDANVLVEKSPPFLLLADQLAHHFPQARFLIMVRNPYAIVEGILRRTRNDRPDAAKVAARHVIACFDQQRRNRLERQSDGVFFTYEELCASPEAVEKRVQALVPDLMDLSFRQRIPVKGMYDEMLRDMNRDHLARLPRHDLGEINKVFLPARGSIEEFGYDIIE